MDFFNLNNQIVTENTNKIVDQYYYHIFDYLFH